MTSPRGFDASTIAFAACLLVALCVTTVRSDIYEEVFGIHISQEDTEDATCIWYGSVKYEEDGKTVSKPKFDNRAGVPATPAQQALLQQYCTELIADNPADTKVCCDMGQLAGLNFQLAEYQQMFNRCPSCFENMRKFYCAYNCSPYQSLFMHITETKDVTPIEKSSLENFDQEGDFDSLQDSYLPVRSVDWSLVSGE